jgi:hypothetical protein
VIIVFQFPIHHSPDQGPAKMSLSRRWQARPRNFTPSQLTASKSTNSIKLASIVIRNYVKMPKMPIFRHRKMHVRIELETWNFVQQLVHVKIKFQVLEISGRVFSGNPIFKQISVIDT